MRDELADDWRAWIAIEDGRVVGQLWMKVFGKIPNPTAEREHHAYISNVYVSPASRGGVGDRLVSAALESARGAGVDSVVLWPSERSRTLYARHGFGTNGRLMELTLSDRSGRS
jgi:ribosomal protein S18 acetylase RimI-like enzyme